MVADPDADVVVPAEMRRDRMLEIVRQRDFTPVSDLAQHFAISEVTVRSDLETLAARGHLRRVRGGAVASGLPRRERPFEESEGAFAGEKLAIGRAAAEMVGDGDTVILDVGTTTAAVARALADRTDLVDVVVFTNSLRIAIQLEPVIPRFQVIVTGGTLRPLQHSLVDPLGDGILGRIHTDLAFIGCNGVDPVAGVTNINLPEAGLKRKMLDAARRRVVVADSSKIGHVDLAWLCSTSEIDELITGTTADATTIAALRDGGLSVMEVGG